MTYRSVNLLHDELLGVFDGLGRSKEVDGTLSRGRYAGVDLLDLNLGAGLNLKLLDGLSTSSDDQTDRLLGDGHGDRRGVLESAATVCASGCHVVDNLVDKGLGALNGAVISSDCNSS